MRSKSVTVQEPAESTGRLLNKALVRKHFDRHAEEYDRHIDVQPQMGSKLLGMIAKSGRKSFASVLEIGCGTGQLTLQLSSQFPRPEQLAAIDLSQAMIAKNKQRLGDKADFIRYVHADAEQLAEQLAREKPEHYDLIVSNATFQWFNDPALTVQRYVQCLKPRGMLAFSTFGTETFRELHEAFRTAEAELGLGPSRHGQAYAPRELWFKAMLAQTDLSAPATVDAANAEVKSDSPLEMAFELPHAKLLWREELLQVYHPTVKHFLHRVKRIGAGNALEKSGGESRSFNRRLLQRMEQIYTQTHDGEKGIPATYHICYGRLIKH